MPSDTAAFMKRLYEEKWDEHDRTSNSPELTTEGHVNVQKVYFYDGMERKSFNNPTDFHGFVNYVHLLVPGTTVHLLLWDKRMTSAPSTPEKGEMNGLCVFSVLVVNAFRCERAAGRACCPCNRNGLILPVFAFRLHGTGNSHTCTCFVRFSQPAHARGTLYCIAAPDWQERAEDEEEELLLLLLLPAR